MLRPRSIRLFERLFLTSLMLWCIVQAMTWSNRVAELAANPAFATPAVAMAAVVLAVLALSVAVWYFAARRASGVARWGAVMLAICSGIAFVFDMIAISQPWPPGPVAMLLSVAASALCVTAAVPLFRPDARAWFDPNGKGSFDG